MLELIVRRILVSIPVLLGVIIVGFAILQLLPSDPAVLVAGPDATNEEIEAIRRDMGLDRPVIEQFQSYLVRTLQLDFGRSLISNRPVAQEIATALGATVELLAASVIWGIPFGIMLGTIAAVLRGSLFDRIVMAITVAGISTPVFLVALLLLVYLGLGMGLPFSGRGGPIWTMPGILHLVLPALTLGLLLIGPVARMTRASLLEVLRSDYVRTARAKGAGPTRLVLRHALPNALIPVVTLVGVQIGFLLSGAVVTETVFSYPGLGRLAVGAISSQDFPLAQGAILVMAVAFLASNLLVDVLYGLLDPRIGRS